MNTVLAEAKVKDSTMANVEDEEALVTVEDLSSEEGTKKETEMVEEEEIDPVEHYPVREFHINLFKEPISFNPLVSAIGCLCLWGLSVWCMGKSARAAAVGQLLPTLLSEIFARLIHSLCTSVLSRSGPRRCS